MPESTIPMGIDNARAMIDRLYNETGRFQWVRESAVNAIEAGATRIDYGLEKNGVEASGVYRRIIADDGCGMDEHELVRFFSTIGASSKSVGGAHENYGIGAKITLLPWNTAGLVVASWKGGRGNVIWAWADDEGGYYGLRQVAVDGEVCDVWPTGYDPDLGFDTEDLKPDWVSDHGTVFLLLGDSLNQDTILNDPRREKGGTRQVRDYITKRFWSFPDSLEVRVDELKSGKRQTWWTPSPGSGHLSSRRAPSMGTQLKEVIEDPRGSHRGVVDLKCGSRIHWILNGSSSAKSDDFFWRRGFIAAKYQGELYEHQTKHHDFRRFGVVHKEVRDRLWLIIEPRLADGSRMGGAFPESDRNSLLWERGGESIPLPWDEWGAEFNEKMPEPLRRALKEHIRGGGLNDPDYKEKLATLFGERFKIPRLRVESQGDSRVLAESGRMRTRGKKPKSASPDSESNPSIGKTDGPQRARTTDTRLGFPDWEACGNEDIEQGCIAAWQPNGPNGPVVLLNVEHPVIRQQVEHWTSHYPQFPGEVEEEICAVYGICAITVVAHSEQLKFMSRGLSKRTVEDQLRSPFALTAALLGLMAQDAVINDRLSGKYGKRQSKKDQVVV